jgi:hypothetical protein
MIDQITFANLFNRATPELVADALRRFQRDKLMAQQQADKAANEGAAAGMAAQADIASQLQQAQQEQEQKQLGMEQIKHEQELEKVALKEGAKTERDIIKMQGLQ